MGNALAGFIRGFAGNQLDQIKARREMEMDEKKARMLAKLQRDGAREDFLFKEDYKLEHDVDPSMSSVNYTTGEVTQKTRGGKVLSVRKMDPAEMAEHAAKTQKAGLDNLNTQGQIAERIKDSGRQDALNVASIGSLNRSNRLEDEGASEGSLDRKRADALLTSYSREVGEAVRSNNISQSAVRQGALEFVRNSRNGEEMQTGFIKWLDSYRKGSKATDQRNRRPSPSLDSISDGASGEF